MSVHDLNETISHNINRDAFRNLSLCELASAVGKAEQTDKEIVLYLSLRGGFQPIALLHLNDLHSAASRTLEICRNEAP
jgi:hypothetical protein